MISVQTENLGEWACSLRGSWKVAYKSEKSFLIFSCFCSLNSNDVVFSPARFYNKVSAAIVILMQSIAMKTFSVFVFLFYIASSNNNMNIFLSDGICLSISFNTVVCLIY